MDHPIFPMTITRGQVAELLGVSENTFDKRRAALEGAGFPRKLPAMTTWSRPAVEDWIRTNGGTYAGPLLSTGWGALDEARDQLSREYVA